MAIQMTTTLEPRMTADEIRSLALAARSIADILGEAVAIVVYSRDGSSQVISQSPVLVKNDPAFRANIPT